MKQNRNAAITQAMLHALIAARKTALAAATDRDALRDQIARMLARGATIEPGVLAAKLVTRKCRTFSRKKLIAVLGEAGFTELAQRVDVTEQTHLVVEENETADPPPPRRRSAPRDGAAVDADDDGDF